MVKQPAEKSLTSTSEELILGQRGYKIEKKLGEGSYATVYLAVFTKLSSEENIKKLACKIIDVSKAPKDFVKKFLPRELEVLVKINHPHIIHIHSIFQRRNKYYIFMRFAENGDLLEFILGKGPVSEAQARVWIRQLCLAVQYLHDLNIVHRDLKCENALITQNYNIKLADFGFARSFASNKKCTSTTYCGSLSYAAPEILRGLPYHPKLSDVWSLGIILYVMLNKALPFDDSNVKWLYEQQVGKMWKIRSKMESSLSDNIKDVLKNVMEPDISKRWTINKILQSEWMKMDLRLMKLSSAEKLANESARGESESTKKVNVTSEEKYLEDYMDVKVLKSTISSKKVSITVTPLSPTTSNENK